MSESQITITLSLTEAAELAVAAEIGNEPGRAYVEHGEVTKAIATLRSAIDAQQASA